MVSILENNFKYSDDVFSEFPILQSERFYLKEITEKNFNDIYVNFSDDDVMRFSGINVVEPFKQVKNYIKTISLMYKKKSGIRWAIYEKLTNNFVGDIGLFNIDKEENSIEIGYLISKKYWNKGIGKECTKEIIKFAFDNFSIKKVIAIIDMENLNSIKLVKKLEFKIEYEFTRLCFGKSKRRYYKFSYAE